MSTIATYLPGLVSGLSWNPSTRELSFDYNEKMRFIRKMPNSFTSDDFIKVMEINSNWRGWRSHTKELSFNPVDFGLASAETPIEAIYLFVNSF